MIPAIIVAFVIWGVVQNLRSLYVLPDGTRFLALLLPVAAYVVLERAWVTRRPAGTIARALVLLILILIPVGIVTPGLEGVFLRKRQKDSMMNMRAIGVAIEVYAVNHGHYPITPGEIAGFSTTLPGKDAWGRPFLLDLSTTSYTILSRGFDPKRPDDDIVYRDGQFIRQPEGIVLPSR